MGRIVTPVATPEAVIALAADDSYVFWATNQGTNAANLFACAVPSCLDDGGVVGPLAGVVVTPTPGGSAPRGLTIASDLPPAGSTVFFTSGSLLNDCPEGLGCKMPPGSTFYTGPAATQLSSVSYEPGGGPVVWSQDVGTQSFVYSCVGSPGNCPSAIQLATENTGALREVTAAGRYIFWLDLGTGALMRANAH
jgi:hypothetical protein